MECDGPEAEKLLKKAFELGDGTVAHILGILICGGMQEVEVNQELGAYYYRKAKKWTLSMRKMLFMSNPLE